MSFNTRYYVSAEFSSIHKEICVRLGIDVITGTSTNYQYTNEFCNILGIETSNRNGYISKDSWIEINRLQLHEYEYIETLNEFYRL